MGMMMMRIRNIGGVIKMTKKGGVYKDEVKLGSSRSQQPACSLQFVQFHHQHHQNHVIIIRNIIININNNIIIIVRNINNIIFNIIIINNNIIIQIIIIRNIIIIIITWPWTAFGRRAKMGSSFKYSYKRLATLSLANTMKYLPKYIFQNIILSQCY